MQFLLYFTISASVLFLSYRISFWKAFALSISAGTFILLYQIKAVPYHALVFFLYINSLPVITRLFKKDAVAYKEVMRERFEQVKQMYGALLEKDKRQIESNLEREKRLQHVLSLYEISKEMSSCLDLEDILDIFYSTLKKSFRFRLSKLVILKDSKDIDGVYRVELGRRVSRAAPDNFDREAVSIALATGKMLSISSQEDSILFKRLSVIKDFETLLSIPLFVHDHAAGVLYVENMSRVHFENFIILANQFAIHFQKVMLYSSVQKMAITDSLTEVGTRRYFLERFSEEIRRSMRHKLNLALLMLDLDHFKEMNDRLGHLVGDAVLKEVAGILKSSLREIDVVGRYGGEEFSILLTGVGREMAVHAAERIRGNIAGAVFRAYDEVLTTTVSIGISTFPDDGVDVPSLIEGADKALYKAKESGRNRVC